MEQANIPERHISHDQPILTPEQLALKALVDNLYWRSDTRAFAIINKYLRERAHERENQQ